MTDNPLPDEYTLVEEPAIYPIGMDVPLDEQRRIWCLVFAQEGIIQQGKSAVERAGEIIGSARMYEEYLAKGSASERQATLRTVK